MKRRRSNKEMIIQKDTGKTMDAEIIKKIYDQKVIESELAWRI